MRSGHGCTLEMEFNSVSLLQMASRFLLVVAVASVAAAYSNTAPVVAWSSSSSSSLDSLPARLDDSFHSVSLLESIVNSEDACTHDALVIIDQPGLHASDLRTLSPDSHISRRLKSSPSSRQFPYLPAHPEQDLTSLAQSVSSKCGSRFVQHTPGQNKMTLHRNSKHVVCMGMPQLEGSGRERKETMEKHENLLSAELSKIASAFPNHLIIFSGSPALSKRQSPDFPDRPALDLSSTSSSSTLAPGNTTLPEGGILKKYQLLTPGLITSLLVAFFILVPVVLMGMNALASIQNPIRSDVSKTFSAQERKNQ